MGHIGNWSERKIALERSRTVERAKREAAARPEIRIHLWGRHFNLLTMHPCATHRLGLRPTATCCKCGRKEEVNMLTLLHTKHAHTDWPEVMPMLRCSRCKAPPLEIAFHKGDLANHAAAYRGRLSIRPPPKDEAPPPGWSEECDAQVRKTL